MTKDGLPYVRFYMSDWLSATRGMKANEIGIYFTALALMYERGEPLPEQYDRLARQCGCTPSVCEKVIGMLIEDGRIMRTEGGLWNKRVQKEFEFRREKSKASTEAIKSRWGKTNENNADEIRTNYERTTDVIPKPEARSQNINISSSEEIRIVDFGAEKEAFEIFKEAVRGTPIPEPKKLTKDRAAKLKQRLSEHGLDGWREACRRATASDFCRGGNEKGWVADFDFLLQPASLNKLIEGRYDNRAAKTPFGKMSAFQQRQRDNIAFYESIIGKPHDPGTDDFGASIDLGPEDFGPARAASSGH